MEIKDFTIQEIHQGLIKKEFLAIELCQSYLDKIRQNDKDIRAFLNVSEDLALSQAKKVDEMITQGRKISLLAGVPCAIKDNILVEDIKCTAGSKILENYPASYDATVIKKLKEQGAVILGKTNLDEFAMGSSTENSAFFPTKNPLDLERVPGGSSGGSAAAVAGNLSVYALGSDTGGSIRLPASFCGVVGLKPTYGAISRYGLIAFASSLDQIGPITKTVEDAKIVFDAIKGEDEMDSTSVKNSKFEIRNSKFTPPPFDRKQKETEKVKSLNFDTRTKGGGARIPNSKFEIRNLKIGIPKEYFVKGIDPEVEEKIKKAIKKYEEMGVKIEEVSLSHTEYALPSYYIINSSEVSANLARYDGIKYGFSKTQSLKLKVQSLMDVYLESRGEGFGQEVRRRIMLGTYVLSSGFYEAYYLRAQKVRTLIREDFKRVFEKVDAIFAPVSPTSAFKLGEKIADPLKMYLSDIFTVSVNLAGLPAISIPVGKVDNLPVGLQIIGKPFEEEKILDIAYAYDY